MSSLECRICCERFESSRKVPKNLDCGHYYCLECLQKEYARRVNNFKCPECQTEVRKKPDELVTNYSILSDASDISRNSQYFCVTCKKAADFECEKNIHPFISMAAHTAQQTKTSREAVEAHKNILENVLSKVINLQEVLEGQLRKTVEEQDKIESLLRRLPANGIAGPGAAGGLQDALREAKECAAGMERLQRGQQLLMLDKGSWSLSVQAEAEAGGAGAITASTASLDLTALAAQQPDVLAVAQYLFFLLAREGQLGPKSHQQRSGGAGRQQRGPGGAAAHANGQNGRYQHGGHGASQGHAAPGRGGASSVADMISNEGVLDLGKNGIGDSVPDARKAEKAALLKSSKKVIELTGLKCDKDPTFCTQLIQKHANDLEILTLSKIKQEHFNLLGSLRRIKDLKLQGNDGHLTANLQPPPDCQVKSLYMTLPLKVQVSLWETFASSLQNVVLRVEVQASVDVHNLLRKPATRTPNLRTVHLHRKSSDLHNPADCDRQMRDIRDVLPPGVRLSCNMCPT